jgi:hypothetical protein
MSPESHDLALACVGITRLAEELTARERVIDILEAPRLDTLPRGATVNAPRRPRKGSRDRMSLRSN